ncbi:MAG: hypothetical protein O7G83_09995 [Proteobacteria bacterium]|nr:hypothetical protein [Pseudomonadota bacterium]
MADSSNGTTTRLIRLAAVDGHRIDTNGAPSAQVALQRSSDDTPPFPIDAIVLEEDTGLVLNAELDIRDDGGHPIRIMTNLYDFEAAQVGEVIVRGRNPYRFLAVVHDFEREPACREAWVVGALRTILKKCVELRIRALGMQMLGTRFGPFTRAWFIQQLESELAAFALGRLDRIWLMDEPDDG